MLPEVRELERLHVEQDLPLAVIAWGIGMSESGLSRLLSNPDRTPFKRTLHKIRRFLAERPKSKRSKRSRA